MRIVYDLLRLCDASVLGSPVYFDTVSAHTKLMIDRCNCLMPNVKLANGTISFEKTIRKNERGVFIAVAGLDQEFETIQTTIKGFFGWANIKLDCALVYSHDGNVSGNIKNDREKMQEAREIGVRLVS